MCQELGIEIDLEKNVEELELGDFAEEIDAMDWMLTHQLSSKNLSPGEKLAMMDKFKEEVRIENEKKRLSTLKQNQTANRSLQLEASDGNNRDRSLNTDRQTAQKAGVGVGTVARYDAVMKSDNEELKKKVQTGEVKIGTAYREIKGKEKVPIKPKEVNTYKDIIHQYSEHKVEDILVNIVILKNNK